MRIHVYRRACKIFKNTYRYFQIYIHMYVKNMCMHVEMKRKGATLLSTGFRTERRESKVVVLGIQPSMIVACVRVSVCTTLHE